MSSMYKVTASRNERKDIQTARLNISVGQPYHEGEKFLSLCEWVSRHFNKCVVNMCDSLQRHNLEAMNISSKQAHSMALANGDAWIERNRNAIESLPNVSIVRWDDWRKGAYWDYAVERANHLYEGDLDFRDIVDGTAQKFISKRDFNSQAELENATLYSKRYIMEEVAFALVSSFDDVADIYPGTYLPAFDYMRDNGIPAPQSMTSVSFKRKKQTLVA